MAALEAKEVPGKGRGAVAARPIRGGETVLSEQPLLMWPQHSTAAAFCSHCLRAFNSLGKHRCSLHGAERMYCYWRQRRGGGVAAVSKLQAAAHRTVQPPRLSTGCR